MQLGKRIAQESNRSPFQRVYTGEIRELLDESILVRAIVRTPNDIRRLKVTKGNIKKSI